MKISKRLLTVIAFSVMAVIIMTLIENNLQHGYWVKSILKVLVFGGFMLLYSMIYRIKLTDMLNIKNRLPSRKLIMFMIAVYAIVIIGYLLLKDHIDLETIRQNLMNKENLTKDNFYWIFLYIILFNSLLEESFFRGFIFQGFKREGHVKAGYIYGSLIFSLYHIGIMSGWFNPLIFILALISLSVAGILLQYIEESNDNLLASYMVHACANLAINTIGTLMILFQ